MTQNRTTIKILGNIDDVKSIAQKIETLFPFYIESPIKLNDHNDGVHLYITLPAENKNGFSFTPQPTEPLRKEA